MFKSEEAVEQHLRDKHGRGVHKIKGERGDKHHGKNGDGNGKRNVDEQEAVLTKVIGMDCERVGVGHSATNSVVARVGMVNQFGHPIYDKYVANSRKVTDYRTPISGIRPQDLVGAPNFNTVQKEVRDLLKGRILVGHGVKHDLHHLHLNHPEKDIRDTSRYKPFIAEFRGKTPSLKNLAARKLGVEIQVGEHSSVQDAQAATKLYNMISKEWEAVLCP